MPTVESVKVSPRQIRRAFGKDASELIAVIDIRSRRAASILRRGFWGRLKWLVFGR